MGNGFLLSESILFLVSHGLSLGGILGRRTCYLRMGMWDRRRRGSCFIRLWRIGLGSIMTIGRIGGIRTCLLLPVGNLLHLGMNWWLFVLFRFDRRVLARRFFLIFSCSPSFCLPSLPSFSWAWASRFSGSPEVCFVVNSDVRRWFSVVLVGLVLALFGLGILRQALANVNFAADSVSVACC